MYGNLSVPKTESLFGFQIRAEDQIQDDCARPITFFYIESRERHASTANEEASVSYRFYGSRAYARSAIHRYCATALKQSHIRGTRNNSMIHDGFFFFSLSLFPRRYIPAFPIAVAMANA